MRGKSHRYKEIIAVIEAQHLGTQAEIGVALRRRGLVVSQATLSKDLKDLGAVKAPTADGVFRYVLSTGESSTHHRRVLRQEMADLLVGMERAGHLLVLRTPPANAPGLAAALDDAHWKEVVGTVAGDDTILVVCKTPQQAVAVMQRISTLNPNL